MALLCKNKKEGGSARASPVAAPMPKSVSFREKRETAPWHFSSFREKRANVSCMRMLINVRCVPFTDGVAWYL